MTNTPPSLVLPTRVAAVRFQRVGKLYHFDCSDHPNLDTGDQVIVETLRGQQMGEVAAFYPPEPDRTDYRAIVRLATPQDLMLRQTWEEKQLPTLIACREAAKYIGGYDQCKFLAAQYSYNGLVLTILYSSDDPKLNINRLKTYFAGKYPNSRLDFRMVGPRDVAKLIGGMGACGIPRCCSTFLTDFSPISIKMAKMQGISLNPAEITGMCGRLRCCLVYEYEQYVEARKVLPKRNKRVGTPHGPGKVLDIHPLKDAVTVLVEEAYYLVQREDLLPLDELEALEGKAKAGCSRHESGGCDCGSKHGNSGDADEADAESDFNEDEDSFDELS
jgi:cell fate regulator YaaT (PSP1 superfamily)